MNRKTKDRNTTKSLVNKVDKNHETWNVYTFSLQNRVTRFNIYSSYSFYNLYLKNQFSSKDISVMHNKTLSVSSMEIMGVYLVRSGFSQNFTLTPLFCLSCEDAEGCHICFSIIAWGKHGILILNCLD